MANETRCNIRIGTSGYHYDHWKELFYPAKLAKNKWLEHYATCFDTVELNNTFYQLPRETTFEKWHSQVPQNFIFTVKANRYITHLKRLHDPAEPLERFFQRVILLKKKLGPILYQLPPNFHKNLDLLSSFIKLLPDKSMPVFEFRHKSWFDSDTAELLDKLRAAFCIHDMPGAGTPRIVTAKFIYIRFHGPAGKYAGNYSKTQLHNWAKWINENKKHARGVYIYFNNDANAYAIQNAKTLKDLLKIT